MNAQQIKAEIARRIPRAESGEQWAEICALEQQLVELEASPYTNCDICDVRPGYRGMTGCGGIEGVICEECDKRNQ